MAKHFTLAPLSVSFGAIVTGLDLRRMSDDAFEELYDSWLEYGLLIFSGQFLDNGEQSVFARRFGELEFDTTPISNVTKNGSVRIADETDKVIQILKGNMGWHCDSTYMPVQAKGAVFTAHVLPSQGGETGWADLCAGYDVLDPARQKAIEGLSAYHSLYHSQAKAGYEVDNFGEDEGYGFFDQEPPLRPLVKIHPETGRKSLLIGRHAYGIPGMPPFASEALLQELLEITCQPSRVYYHRWSKGDAVVWDNRRLLHRACPWDMAEPRIMYHTRLAGDQLSEYAAPG